MKKSKLIIIIGAILLTGFSSCGIFKKGCGCPKFGVIKCADFRCAGVQMMG
ncbi:hypothetical protein [Mucilaginibacter sp. FT3.2]|uniref:hypothetical protein n=1 Tax=Mucilaginibacter sp. FT3.2 TaxID=2723090 RepID=UPI00161ECCF0|nr:hypothetical protein [Mucilaginibacter sp. FT3.2]MBB6230776.1 hypothetical protein [Mucilaginibacter sp. FT3.2]